MKSKIDRLIEECRNKCKENWHNVFYIALYGSQNYNIDTISSDYDFKAIIIPTLEDLVSQKKPVSTVYAFDWGQLEVKDIRNYIESAVKVNVNFIELLNTQFFWASNYEEAEKFRSCFKPLLDEEGEIYLRACRGMVLQKFHALRHPFPSKEEVLKKHGYDPKQLCHIIRLTWLMQRYIKGDYSFFHHDVERDWLIDVKYGMYKNEQVDEIAKKYIDECDKIISSYNKIPSFNTKYELINFSRNLITKYITNAIKWNNLP